MSKLVTSVVLLLALVGVSCSGHTDPPQAKEKQASTPTTDESPSPPAERGITDPPGVVLVNGALGEDRKLIAQAVDDVKAVGFWRELTGHLYSVRIGLRPGVERIPEDGHLADALRTLKLDGDVGGIYCQITFYSAAMSQDLERVGEYFDQGLVASPPPTERQFYASILGHELAHCLGQGKGEAVAQEWEARVLGALEDKGIE